MPDTDAPAIPSTLALAEGSVAADERRRPTPLEWAALVAGLVPVVAAVVRAWADDWMPTGDAALVVVRSRDVLTSNHPWGSYYLDLLAPFTKLSPFGGTALGAGIVNAVCVVLVWLVARRVFRPVVVATVMLGTLLLMSTLGLSWLIDARPQFAMVLPMYTLLWVSVGMWSGVGFAAPAAVAVASLCAQSHYTLVYQAVLVWLVGAAGFALVSWRRAGPDYVRRVAVWCGAVAAVCWIQPFIGQFFVSNNLGSVLAPTSSGSGAGLGPGAQVVANAVLEPPFWLPGSIGSFLGPGDEMPTASAIVIIAMWLAAAAAVISLGWRSSSVVPRVAGVSALVAVIASIVAAIQIPPSLYGLAAPNYYWLWSLGTFVTLVLAAGLLSLPDVAVALRRAPASARWSVPIAGTLAVLVIAVWPRYALAEVELAEADAESVGRALQRDLEESLTRHAVGDTVEVNLGAGLYSDHRYLVLIELQRAGIGFRIAEGDGTLGESRCTVAGVYPQVSFVRGRGAEIPEGMRLLATAAGVTDDEAALYDELSRRFGDLLRDGTISVDITGVEWYFNQPLDQLREVLSVPGTSAAGLALSLDTWRQWDMVFRPPDLRTDFDRWVELERRIDTGFVNVVYVPSSVSEERDGSC